MFWRVSRQETNVTQTSETYLPSFVFCWVCVEAVEVANTVVVADALEETDALVIANALEEDDAVEIPDAVVVAETD